MKRFSKKALPLAVAAAVMMPGFAAAEGESAAVSGFADITYSVANDAGGEGLFLANGEIDISAAPADGVSVRLDLDTSLATDAAASSVNLEQVYFAWGVTEEVTVLGGIFNNPIGAEAEDAPDMNFVTHGVVYNILNHQTALYGDNVAGLAAAAAVGPATVTVAYLDDLQLVSEKNSVAVVVNASPMKGLDLEVGYATQDGGAENVTNINAAYMPIENLTLAVDYLIADEVVKNAYEFSALYTMGEIGLGFRTEAVSYGIGDQETNTRNSFRVSYQVASNLSAAIEMADGDMKETIVPTVVGSVDGIADGSATMLELIATF